jgi:hypothetical protein
MSLSVVPHSPTASTDHRSTTSSSPSLTLSSRSPPMTSSSTIAARPLIDTNVSPRLKPSKHSRSNSTPSLQPVTARTSIDYATTTSPPHSSSTANLLLLGPQARRSHSGFAPQSPRLMPIHSPGPVTPMQLEEDMEYQFPTTTPVRNRSLLVPQQEQRPRAQGEDERDEGAVEIPWRKRTAA